MATLKKTVVPRIRSFYDGKFLRIYDRCRGYSGLKSKRVILDSLNLNKLCILFINDKCRNRKY